MEVIIEGMSCKHCVAAVEKALQELNVKNLKVEIGKAVLDSGAGPAEVKSAVEDAGYTVSEIR